jgi:hypothetical protein
MTVESSATPTIPYDRAPFLHNRFQRHQTIPSSESGGRYQNFEKSRNWLREGRWLAGPGVYKEPPFTNCKMPGAEISRKGTTVLKKTLHAEIPGLLLLLQYRRSTQISAPNNESRHAALSHAKKYRYKRDPVNRLVKISLQ